MIMMMMMMRRRRLVMVMVMMMVLFGLTMTISMFRSLCHIVLRDLIARYVNCVALVRL